MAIDRVPALKRCRSLGIEPAVIGLSKESKRQPRRTNRKVSEYGTQLKEKQKAGSNLSCAPHGKLICQKLDEPEGDV